MKLTRAAFLASLGAIILTAGVAVARPGNGGGNGGGNSRPGPKVVVNGAVVSVGSEETGNPGTFVVHRRGARAGRRGADVTVLVMPDTVFRSTDGSETLLEDVVVGARLQVKGRKNREDGSVLATRVLIKVPEPEEEPED